MATRLFLCLLAVMGAFGAVVSCYDKWAAKHNPKHRTPEKTLLWLSALGGSFLMYLTMQFIRHKTKHKNIMWGLRFAMLAHLLILGFLLYREGYLNWWIQLF